MAFFLNCSGECLEFAADFLRSGKLVAFPTETVYGLGANACNDEAVLKIYELKGRPKINPLIAHYPSADSAFSKDVIVNTLAEKLAAAFWPGPMTLVLKRSPKSEISSVATAGLDTLAVRVPKNSAAHDLLSLLDFPVVAPSANKSTTLSTTTAMSVLENFDYSEDLCILDGGNCDVGIESTIVDISDGKVAKILRHGVITKSQISEFCDVYDETEDFGKDAKVCQKPIAPGMMFKHYAPEHAVEINAVSCSGKDAFLDFGAQFPELKSLAVAYLDLSEKGDLKEAAFNLFRMLRMLDDSKCEKILVAPIKCEGVGVAINDKLQRAAGKIGAF